jgi:hypothetical protein
MPFVLSDEAIQKLEDDPVLAAQVAVLLEIKTTSMGTMILRKSKALNTWHTVELIAKAMNKKPKDILIKIAE